MNEPEPPGQLREIGAQRETRSHGGERVQDVVLSRNTQLDATEQVVVVDDVEAGRARMRFDPARDEARIARRDSVANDFRRARGGEMVRASVVRAQHDRPRAPHELGEGPLDVGDVGVDVEVIRLDVRDDGDRRRQREERAVVFVRLDDVQSLGSGEQVPSPRRNPPADERRGFTARRGERDRRHDRRRRLAVRSGNADQFKTGGDLTQRLSPTNHRDAQLAGAHQFRMRLGHRGGHDEGARPFDMRGIVRPDVHSKVHEVGRAFGIRIASRDVHPSPDEQLGERAHTGSGYPDKVNRTRVVGIEERHVVVGQYRNRFSRLKTSRATR